MFGSIIHFLTAPRSKSVATTDIVLLYVIVEVFARFRKISGLVWSSHGLYFGENVIHVYHPWPNNLFENIFENRGLSTWGTSFMHERTQAPVSHALENATPSKDTFRRQFVMKVCRFVYIFPWSFLLNTLLFVSNVHLRGKGATWHATSP